MTTLGVVVTVILCLGAVGLVVWDFFARDSIEPPLIETEPPVIIPEEIARRRDFVEDRRRKLNRETISE